MDPLFRKRRILLTKKVLSTAKPTQVDNRTITNSKIFNAKSNIMPTRKDLCLRSELSNVSNESILNKVKRYFHQK